MPHRQTFVRAVLLSAIHYLCILAAATTLFVYTCQPSPLSAKVFIGFMFLSVASWVLAFVKRRHTHCPLCKGTPLINSGALSHKKASRLFPFNHGVTATLSIIAMQKFRCMYCGTEFDLLKTPSHHLQNGEGKYSAYNTYTSEDKT